MASSLVIVIFPSVSDISKALSVLPLLILNDVICPSSSEAKTCPIKVPVTLFSSIEKV